MALRLPAWSDTPDIEWVEQRIREIRALYSRYVDGDDGVFLDYLRGCLFKSNLDVLCRAQVNPWELDYFAEDARDLADLVALTGLTQHRKCLFSPTARLILNPSFGELSSLVSGADADVILDDLLIEIKVHARANSPYAGWQHQLIGYWLLATMNGAPDGIEHLGVYLARDGVLFTLPVAKVITLIDLVDFGARFLAEVAKVNTRVRKHLSLRSTPADRLCCYRERLRFAVDRIDHLSNNTNNTGSP